MTEATPLIEDRTYLRHFWHPVCTVAELAQTGEDGAGPLAATLLDEDIVIARLDGEIAALVYRCALCFAKLSLGKVTGGNIQCPYHGWQYDGTGMCRRMPAAPDMKMPKKPLVDSYDCREKYDLVWVRLDSSWACTEIPHCSAWENPDFKKIIVAEPYEWKSSSERRWENFTDFSHFAYVHPGTLFDPAYDEVEIVPMDRIDGEFRFALAPGRDMLDRLPPDSPLGSFTYRAGMPYTVDLMISLYRDNTPFLLWTTSSPTTTETCRNFMIIAHVNGDQPDSDALDFQKIVLDEDQPVIESQPGILSVEEASLPTDKISREYRKWHKELSVAASAGRDAFEKALLTNIVESE